MLSIPPPNKQRSIPEACVSIAPREANESGRKKNLPGMRRLNRGFRLRGRGACRKDCHSRFRIRARNQHRDKKEKPTMNPTPAETTVPGEFRTGPTTAAIVEPSGTRTEILPGDGTVGVNH
jgi:hypothetical protein